MALFSVTFYGGPSDGLALKLPAPPREDEPFLFKSACDSRRLHEYRWRDAVHRFEFLRSYNFGDIGRVVRVEPVDL